MLFEMKFANDKSLCEKLSLCSAVLTSPVSIGTNVCVVFNPTKSPVFVIFGHSVPTFGGSPIFVIHQQTSDFIPIRK